MATEQLQRIDLELAADCGSLQHEFTCHLDNPIRVFTHPFRLKLSTITLRRISFLTELPLKYEVMIRRNPNSATAGRYSTGGNSLGTFEKNLILTEDIAKNFRIISQYFQMLPYHGELHDGRPHYHQNPEFVYDGRKVVMTFPRENTEYAQETDQTYIRFINSPLAEMLGVSLQKLNEMLANPGKVVQYFEDPKVKAHTDLYVYCDIAARSGYKGLSSDLIRVIHIPENERLVHINFDDDLWVLGENKEEILLITMKLRDSKGEPWLRVHADWCATITLEGNLYKTTSPSSREIPRQ